MKHKLKTDPDVFDAVMKGIKPFEIRKNDRDYQIGDELMLKKTRYTGEEMKNGKPLEYTGDVWTVKVIYVLYGPIYGLQDGWCIMSTATVGEAWPCANDRGVSEAHKEIEGLKESLHSAALSFSYAANMASDRDTINKYLINASHRAQDALTAAG